MKSSTRPEPADWRDNLPPYGQPAVHPVVQPPVPVTQPRRRRSGVGGWLLALGLGAAIAAIAVSNMHDPRSLGAQLDDAVSSVREMGSQAGRAVADSQSAAVDVSRNALDGVTTAVDDTAISLKVKTALAADPALSAPRIDVTTTQGIVRLEGPAPDQVAKDRATVLAGAPEGVRGVDNRLTLPQAPQVVAVGGSTAPTLPPTSPAAKPQ
ncbi:MAG: BON domain-containing protein [Roseateles sp.]|uniref:BON domain-containing protein n=1 Tax=Roseateles sp. TaxID=1971397 RepID=UPI0040365B81